MSAVANPGLADVLNILSNSASPALSSLLSSSKVQSALQNASPADLVQLSDQALQLQAVDSLFGTSDSGPSSTPDPNATLESIVANLTQSGSTPVANQLALYQGQLQAENTQALFGATSSSVNLLG
jgi:hypothetical protein